MTMSTVGQPQLVCLTPVKDEAWILDRFLTCAERWADHIIVADQNSTDGSREIVGRHPKAILIENTCPTYDEGARQRLLLEAARRTPEPRVLIALDADELLTANWADSPEWASLKAAAPGTVIKFQWVNLRSDMKTSWIPSNDIPFGFVDDGSYHAGSLIHSRRLPIPSGAPSLVMRDVKVLHYQYTDWLRMESKQRWYQCWEKVNQTKRPAHIYRQYHFMHAIPSDQFISLRPEWIDGYHHMGIDVTSIHTDGSYCWDRQVLQLIADHGPLAFRQIDIWDVDWQKLAKHVGLEGDFADPRRWLDKVVVMWLQRSQRCHTHPLSRLIQWFLQFVSW